MRKLSCLFSVIFLLLTGFVFANSVPVDVAVTVVGNVFAMEVQDGNGFPLGGELDLGTLEPGQSDFPVGGVVVVGCQSNHGYQWSLQTEADEMVDPETGTVMKNGLKVRGLDSTRSPGGVALPGNLVTVEQNAGTKPVIVYTSNANGDLGFNNSAGTYVALGFGVDVPAAQPAGTYSSRILLTLTE